MGCNCQAPMEFYTPRSGFFGGPGSARPRRPRRRLALALLAQDDSTNWNLIGTGAVNTAAPTFPNLPSTTVGPAPAVPSPAPTFLPITSIASGPSAATPGASYSAAGISVAPPSSAGGWLGSTNATLGLSNGVLLALVGGVGLLAILTAGGSRRRYA